MFYDEAGQCSICRENFEDGERVCRLRCRHMFHSACWEQVMSFAGTPNEAAGGNTRFRDDCPNCRGQGALIAVWEYVDPDLLTQRTDWRLPTSCDGRAARSVIGTAAHPIRNHAAGLRRKYAAKKRISGGLARGLEQLPSGGH